MWLHEVTPQSACAILLVRSCAAHLLSSPFFLLQPLCYQYTSSAVSLPLGISVIASDRGAMHAVRIGPPEATISPVFSERLLGARLVS